MNQGALEEINNIIGEMERRRGGASAQRQQWADGHQHEPVEADEQLLPENAGADCPHPDRR
jgi:hypothetical protein